nr:MAG TPA: Selenoprotein S (SelS) [Caudoviricetes sp.]
MVKWLILQTLYGWIILIALIIHLLLLVQKQCMDSYRMQKEI